MAVKKLASKPKDFDYIPISQSRHYKQPVELECDEETKALIAESKRLRDMTNDEHHAMANKKTASAPSRPGTK